MLTAGSPRAARHFGRGLNGPLIVEEAEPPRVDRELTWMLDDWRLDRRLLGSPATNDGKVGFYFREPAGAQIHWLKSQTRVGDVTNPQLLMAATGRNTAGTTSSPYVRFWLRQNRSGLWEAISQASNLSSTAIAATQFLRSTGSSTNGYFHGHLYELLLYDGTLDDETTFDIEDWLAERYGLT